MPRQNKKREVFAEVHVAGRIAAEREARGWSYDGLAQRMSDVGCAIQPSALYKIEKGDPPRRITVDEFVALSQVFTIPMAELAADPKVQLAGHAAQLLERAILALISYDAVQELWEERGLEADRRVDELARFLDKHPGVAWEKVQEHVKRRVRKATTPGGFVVGDHLEVIRARIGRES